MPTAPVDDRGPARHPGAAGPPTDHQWTPPGGDPRSAVNTAAQASSRCFAGAVPRRPATRYGCVTRARPPRRRPPLPNAIRSARPRRRPRRAQHQQTAHRADRQVGVHARGPPGYRRSGHRAAPAILPVRSAHRRPRLPARFVDSPPAPAHPPGCGSAARRRLPALASQRLVAPSGSMAPAPAAGRGPAVRPRRPPLRIRRTSPRQATSIARRSRGVVPPQTPWQSPTSSAQARHGPWTSQLRQSATAASAGSFGAGKNVSGSTLWQVPLVRHASSCCRSLNARSSRGSRRAAATSCGRGIRARVNTPTSPVGPANDHE